MDEPKMETNAAEVKKSNRGAAMAKVWAARRAWAQAPVCCCGCNTTLAANKNPKRQSLFAQGHDGRLHSLLMKVLRGDASRQDIPMAARANLARIKFIQADPALQRAFANPGQKAIRNQKAQA